MRRHARVVGGLLLSTVAATGIALLAQGRATAPPAQRPAAAAASAAAGGLVSPMEQWGHNIGDDYFLVNYKNMIEYWQKLEKASPRIHLVQIGPSSEKRPMIMAIITSPENYRKIERYRDISRRLALAEGLDDVAAHALAKEGKSVVWIDGGIHADEVLGAQQLIEHVWQMVSRTDEETQRFLNDVIQLCVIVNPDGMDLVSDWYNRVQDPLQRTTGGLPVLYNHYAGHDDNRDFYMQALAESTNVNKVMYRDWIPQIMYNHHQTGPAGTVMFAPPFRDPFNYNFHPGAVAGIDVVGAMMAQRFIAEDKPGVTQRKGAPYSTWFNGGIRTTAHFHNIIGILTETIGNPTPQSIPFVASKQLGDSSLWWPIAPQQVWHFRQSIEYSMTANRAILDYASKYRETSLFNIYAMGRDEIRWGSEDHWTFTPHKMAKVQAGLVAKGAATAVMIPGAASTSGVPAGGRGGGRGGAASVDPLYAALRAPELRDPRGFIIPADQEDFGTATKFVNALIKAGITVMRATAPFTVAGKSYPINSYVVKTAQAFRPHVMDMFEPQDHPDDIPYPGGPPTPPYDATGYTLAFQMGVEFDRVLDRFDGPFVPLTDFAKVPSSNATWDLQQNFDGYYFTHKANDSFTVVNRLLSAGENVSWLTDGPLGPGTFYVAAKPMGSVAQGALDALLHKSAEQFGITFQKAPLGHAPAGPMTKLTKVRVGLFDTYGGSMPSGWTRMILEQFEFPFELVFPPQLDAGNLRSNFDVLVFVDIGVPSAAGRGGGGGGGGRGGGAAIPPQYANRQGQVTAQTMEQVKQFVNDGGTALYIGDATAGAAQQFGLPIANQVLGLSQDKYYVPGALLTVAIDNTNPIAHGMPKQGDVFFDKNPAFKLTGDPKAVQSIARFASPEPLHSGWAWGQEHLDKGIEVISAKIGKGTVVLYAPEILFRSQPHGNYKLFFNGLLLAGATRQ